MKILARLFEWIRRFFGNIKMPGINIQAENSEINITIHKD